MGRRRTLNKRACELSNICLRYYPEQQPYSSEHACCTTPSVTTTTVRGSGPRSHLWPTILNDPTSCRRSRSHGNDNRASTLSRRSAGGNHARIFTRSGALQKAALCGTPDQTTTTNHGAHPPAPSHGHQLLADAALREAHGVRHAAENAPSSQGTVTCSTTPTARSWTLTSLA